MKSILSSKRLIIILVTFLLNQVLFAQKPKFGINGIPILPSDTIYPKKEEIRNYSYGSGPFGINLPKSKNLRTGPILGVGIDGSSITTNPGITPMDNTVAISNLTGSLSKRRLIGCNNVAFEIYEEDGTLIANGPLNNWINTFLTIPLTGSFFDPKLIYDPVNNRFVFVCVYYETGNINSKIITLVSVNEDPDAGWICRVIDNPSPSAEWWDYPLIGQSEKDIYISVSDVLTANKTRLSSDIYQIPKSSIYVLGTFPYNVFDDILDIDNLPATILPITDGIPLINGQINSYGPGIYLASNLTTPSISKVSLFDVTDDFSILGIPPMLKYDISLPKGFEVPDAVLQSSTNRRLDPGDSRYQSGFYAEGSIHLVNTTSLGELNSIGILSNANTINYLRIPVANLAGYEFTRIKPSILGVDLHSYGYPSICHIGSSKENKSVAITYLASGDNINPEIRCVTINDAMQTSQESTFRSADGSLMGTLPNIINNPLDRWGDYSSIQRVYDRDECPTFWTAGTFGNIDNKYQSFYGSNLCFTTSTIFTSTFEKDIKIYPNPTKKNFNVVVVSSEPQDVRLNLIDLAGRQLMATNFKLTTGENIIPINTLSLVAGNYFIQLINHRNEKRFAKITIH
jgi:hypothetical protein